MICHTVEMLLNLLLLQSISFASPHVSNEWAIIHPDIEKAIETALSDHETSTGQIIELTLQREVTGRTPKEAAMSELRKKIDPALEHLTPRMIIIVSTTDESAGIAYTTAIDGAIYDRQAMQRAGDTLESHLEQGRPNQAVSRLVLEILYSLGSPVLEGREINELLRSWRVQDSEIPASEVETSPPSRGFGLLLLLIGIGAAVFFIEVLLGLEVQITSEQGSRKVSPIKRIRSRIARLKPNNEIQEAFHGNW